jgi:hypothetical protein
VQQRTAGVDAARPARQHEGHDEIDDESRGRHDHHGRPGDRNGCKQSLDGFDGNPDDQREHGQRIDERGQHFRASIAVGRSLRRRARGHGGGNERDDERRRVGDHVARIRNQRERACEDAGECFEGGETPGQDQRRPQYPPRPARLRRRMLMRVVMRMVTRRVVRIRHGHGDRWRKRHSAVRPAAACRAVSRPHRDAKAR